MNVRLTAWVCAAALIWAGGVWAEGEQAEVISADGQTVTKYATMEAAVGSLTKDGCTVRMLAASANVTARAPVAKSCTIDLCGHKWESAGDHGILISPGRPSSSRTAWFRARPASFILRAIRGSMSLTAT